MKKKISLTLCAMAIFSSTAMAAPSVSGPTGLIDTPSADVLQQGQISLGYYHLKDDASGVFNIGITSKLEIGVAGFNYDKQSDHTYFNAKYNILPESSVTPGLSIGVEDAADITERSSYVVVSKKLPFGFKVNAGIGDGRFDSGFAGIETTINPIAITGNDVFPAATLIVEHVDHTTNYGARVSIIPGLKAEVGRRNHDNYVGVNFTSSFL